jgi:two-component system, sensor histidine kinase and response regulator
MNLRRQDDLTSARRCLHFLLADDAPDMRILVTAYLRHLNCRIDFAQNGRIAVDKVTRGGDYDLVLMDTRMPEMDGYAAARQIRAWEARAHAPRTPILALTACPLDQEIRGTFEAGCDGYVMKPVRKATLLAAIKETLVLAAASNQKGPLAAARH